MSQRLNLSVRIATEALEALTFSKLLDAESVTQLFRYHPTTLEPRIPPPNHATTCT